MVWMVVTRSASAAGKGAAKGAGAVAKGAAKGAKKLGQATGKGAAKGAGKAGKAGTKQAAAGTGKGVRKAGQAGGKAGKAGLDSRDVAQARKAARAGKGDGKFGSGRSGPGRGGSGGAGRGPLGRGKPRGWAGRAVDSATGRGGGGHGGRGLSGGDGGGEATEGVGDGAAAANEALRNFVRNRLRRRRGPFKKTRSRLNRICLILLVLLLGIPLLMGLYGADASSDQMEAVMAMQCSGAPVELMSEQTGIPPEAVAAYCSAAVRWEVNWAILAAIGKVECDHGRGREPGCDPGPPRTVNSKGARGPMQFLGSTWRSSAGDMDLDVSGPPIPKGEETAGYATDGDDDGVADPWSWRDATHATARYLLANGYAEDQRRAIFAYNHLDSYVDEVVALASEYQSKVQSVMDREDLPGGGGGNGLGLALGDCPGSPEGSTAAIPESNNTKATQTMANTLINCFGRNGKSVGCWSERPGDLYEHPRGRACDFMMTGGAEAGGHDRERGTAMAEYAMKHAKELKIIYVIWYRRIWFAGRDAVGPWTGWRSYDGCNGDPSSCHTNHVHVSVHLQPGDPPRARCPHDHCTN